MDYICIGFSGNAQLTFNRHSENQQSENNEIVLNDSEFNKLKMWLEYTGRDTEKIVIKTIDVKQFIIYKNQITYVRM